MRADRVLTVVGAALALLAAAGTAAANGRFPSAEQIVVQPGAPDRVVVRSTFGFLVSSDAGKHFDWICEDAANYGSGLDPGIAVTGDGTILAGVFGGVSIGHGDACSFDLALPQTFISDVTVEKIDPATAFAIGSKSSGGYFLWRSKDDAVHWSQISTLPDGFLPTTVDVAPSDPSRIYASGGLFVDGGSQPSLLASTNGGSTWQVLPIPTGASQAQPFIAGIDPNDPLTVWVRPDVEPGMLLVTHDGGASWTTALTVQGELLAFAISPDGATVLAGGPKAGIWSATVTDAGPPSFQKISDLQATCLAWPDTRVFACADELKAGFALGRSDDGGHTFESLLRIACVRGPLDCPAGSGVAQLCTDEWPNVAMQIHHDACSDAGVDASSGSSSSAASSGGVGGAAASSAAATGSGGGAGHGSGGGCGCFWSGAEPGIAALPALALAALVFRARERRRRRGGK